MNDELWVMDDELWMMNSGEQLIAFGRKVRKQGIRV
jgi:hypothetical protein